MSTPARQTPAERSWNPSDHTCESGKPCTRRAVVFLHGKWACRIHDGNISTRRNYFAAQTKCRRSERGECDALATIMMHGSPHCDKHQIEDEREAWQRDQAERRKKALEAAAPALLVALQQAERRLVQLGTEATGKCPTLAKVRKAIAAAQRPEEGA